MTQSLKAGSGKRGQQTGDGFAEAIRTWNAAPLGRQPMIMGVINVTPDSFSDGGQFDSATAAIAHGESMADEGANILDVGGESTRPGGQSIATNEELDRVLPVIQGLSPRTALLSIDTVKPDVAEKALSLGAHIVNDVQGLHGDPRMAEVIADFDAGLIIMHNPGLFGSSSGTEGDPVAACLSFFKEALNTAAKAGISDDRIAIDPGFGFGKTVDQNLILLNRLGDLHRLGLPIVVGTSRKSFIGRLTERDVDDRLFGTLASNIAAALAGAAILRVHDVRAHKDALTVTAAISGVATNRNGNNHD